MTVLEILKKTEQFFRLKGISSPRLEAELLLSEILCCKRLDLYLNFDKPLSTPEIDGFREMVRRRGKREPFQYIIGKAPFMDFDLWVNKGCLIPRPETEVLIEYLMQQQDSLTDKSFLDIGTGSGAIIIAIARMVNRAKLTAIDYSDEALAIARTNADTLNVKYIDFIKSNLFSELKGGRFDYIVSNPPYIADKEIPELEPEVRDYEPLTALIGGIDGLDFYRSIFGEAAAHLNKGGELIIEHGFNQSEPITEIAVSNGFYS